MSKKKSTLASDVMYVGLMFALAGSAEAVTNESAKPARVVNVNAGQPQ